MLLEAHIEHLVAPRVPSDWVPEDVADEDEAALEVDSHDAVDPQVGADAQAESAGGVRGGKRKRRWRSTGESRSHTQKVLLTEVVGDLGADDSYLRPADNEFVKKN
jgi:hypothetical protein